MILTNEISGKISEQKIKKTLWRKAYAYVIGLNKYQHLRTLDFCEKDAETFASTLSKIIPIIDLKLYKGNTFTTNEFNNVLNAIEEINETDDQSVLFFYSNCKRFRRKFFIEFTYITQIVNS